MSSGLYMLDTNAFSDIANGRSQAARRTMDRLLHKTPLAISAITEAELLFGLARKPLAIRLRSVTEELLSVVQILPWDSSAARVYATLRVHMTGNGKSLSANDTFIAAHALATDAILVTRDKAFAQIVTLQTANWATDL